MFYQKVLRNFLKATVYPILIDFAHNLMVMIPTTRLDLAVWQYDFGHTSLKQQSLKKPG